MSSIKRSPVKHKAGRHSAPRFLTVCGEEFLLLSVNGTPSARRAVRPWPGSAGTGARSTQGQRWTRRVPAASGGAGGESRRWWAAAQARCLSVGTHGTGRRRSAVPPHPPPGGPRRHAPLVSAPARAAGPSSPRRAILSPRKLAFKGATACGLRVPPLRSGQTPDSELPRQRSGTCREDGAESMMRLLNEVKLWSPDRHGCSNSGNHRSCRDPTGISYEVISAK